MILILLGCDDVNEHILGVYSDEITARSAARLHAHQPNRYPRYEVEKRELDQPPLATMIDPAVRQLI